MYLVPQDPSCNLPDPRKLHGCLFLGPYFASTLVQRVRPDKLSKLNCAMTRSGKLGREIVRFFSFLKGQKLGRLTGVSFGCFHLATSDADWLLALMKYSVIFLLS